MFKTRYSLCVSGGENDPLSRLDFPGHDHLHTHPRLKPDDQIHHHTHKLDTLQHHTHKLDTFEGSPISQLSTPIGSPHHSLGDALLSQNQLLGVKGHSTHCSTTNEMSPASSKSPHDGMTLGGDVNKPRIWSIADVATSSTPPPGRRSPNLLTSPSYSLGVGINKGGMAAFSTPVTSHGHMSGFQPWVTGAYPNGTPNHTGLSYGYQLNSHQSLGGATGAQMAVSGVQSGGHSLGGLSGLTHTTGYTTGAKLSSGFLG
jgi:hypothetical protein